jgi:hypothetical protein
MSLANGDAEVDFATSHLTALLARYLPDLLSSLSVVGSAAQADFRPGRSDIDFVAVMRRQPTEDELEGLTIVHRLYGTDPTLPPLDGIWLMPSDLAAGPDLAVRGPATRDGTFLAEAPGNRNPVTWFMLADQSRTIMGELDRGSLWRDEGRLRDWTRENVEAYWAGWYSDAASLTTPRGRAMLWGTGIAWGVLGITRLHATLTTGRILTKTAAGTYALDTFEPRWHRIVGEALRIRRGGQGRRYGNPLARRREALDYVGMVIEAIRRGQSAPD